MGESASGDELFQDHWISEAPRLRRPFGVLWARIRYPKLYFLERKIRQFLAQHPDRTIDVHEHGCGSGLNLHIVRQMLGPEASRVRLSGSDISPKAVRHALQPQAGASFPVEVDDAQASTLSDGTYDIMMSADMLGHLPRLEDAVEHIARCLKPGGWYVTFTETDGYRDDPDSWRHPIVAAAGVDPWIEKDLHINLKPSGLIEQIFHANGFTTIEQHPNLDGGRVMAALGCKDVTEMVAMTGIEPDAYLRRCMWAERVARVTGLKMGLVFLQRATKYVRHDRGPADRGGYYFVLERSAS